MAMRLKNISEQSFYIILVYMLLLYTIGHTFSLMSKQSFYKKTDDRELL